MKNPPILIAVIGFFAALAGFGFLFLGLRMVGFDWFGALGDLPAFERVGLWGWLTIFTGIVWLLAAFGLWALQPWARLFALIMVGIALFEAVLAFFQFPGSGLGISMALMPLLLLWYLNTGEVKAAFGVGQQPAAPAEPTRAAAPAPAAQAAVEAPAAAPLVAAAVAAPAPTPAAPAPAPMAPIAAAAAEPVETPGAAHHVRIDTVEGIGPAYAEKLAGAGIVTTSDLLSAGAKPSDREKIAEATGIRSDLIRAWVDKVDLMRVPGVGPQYSDLLEAGGVGSPAELAQRNPANLAVTLQEVVAARPGIVRRVPSEAEVASWVEAAAALDKVVEH
ncbi:MAG TPA: DUF4332 domain-containing protein [Candidatus Limnocylindrales bacterium]